MPVKCYTRKKNDGTNYTNCTDTKPKPKPKPKKKVKLFKLVDGVKVYIDKVKPKKKVEKPKKIKLKSKPKYAPIEKNDFQNWGQFITKLPYGLADQIVGNVFDNQQPNQMGDFINQTEVKFPIEKEYETYYQGHGDYAEEFKYGDEGNAPPLFQKQIDRFNYLNDKEKNQKRGGWRRDVFNTYFPPNEQREWEKWTQYFHQNNPNVYEESLAKDEFGRKPDRRGKSGKIKPPKPQKLTKKDLANKKLREGWLKEEADEEKKKNYKDWERYIRQGGENPFKTWLKWAKPI